MEGDQGGEMGKRRNKTLSRRFKKFAHATFTLSEAKQLMRSFKEKKAKEEGDNEEENAPPSPAINSLDLITDSSHSPRSSVSSDELSGHENHTSSYGTLPGGSRLTITKAKRSNTHAMSTLPKGSTFSSKQGSVIHNEGNNVHHPPKHGTIRSRMFHFTTIKPSFSLSSAVSQTFSSSPETSSELSAPRSNSLGGEVPSPLGVAAAPQYYVKKSGIPDPYNDRTPLYVSSHDSKDVIIGGSLQQLLNALTDERADTQYIEEFLYTYRYFTSAEKLLEHFAHRYLFTAPADCTTEENALYNDWRGPVQLRVINCIKKWLMNHFEDFERNEELLQRVKNFIKATVAPQNEKWAQKLNDIIHENFVVTINEGGVVAPKVGFLSPEVMAALIKNSELVADRKWRLHKYKQCFVGQEAVDWMMKHMEVDSRQAACELGTKLVNNRLICCVSKSKDKDVFRDTPHSFYQFTNTDTTKKHAAHEPTLQLNNSGSLDTRSPSQLSINPPVNVVINDFSLSATSPDGAEMITIPEVITDSPLLPRKGLPMHLLTVHPREIARQLTMIEFEMYKSIALRELAHQLWNKNNGVDSPHVTTMINRFNEVGFWIATEIVHTYTLQIRINVLKRLIKIAHICKKYGNFNTMMEIAVGLNMGAITRLTKTWQGIDPKSKARYDLIMDLTMSNSNYKNYRETLKGSQLPVLPYVGLHLRDLTFIEDGNPDQLMDGIVNFNKMRLIAKVLRYIAIYQRNKFKFTKVPEIQHFLLHEVRIEKSSNLLYKASYECEPARNANAGKQE